MQAVSCSKAEHKLHFYMNRVCDDQDPYIITQENEKNAVLLSLEEYNSIQETLHLLSSPAND